ncbi:MAG: SDR family oxidoreductase [Chloroflexi bacterium]|nr:SDR family oxidoreductase [Chloroflexota bacterium]
MQNILITGANRGIGLALTRQFLAQDDPRVYAACRNPDGAAQLNKLAQEHNSRVRVLQMDVTDEASINRAVEVVSEEAGALDILVNNAGISGGDHARIMGKLTVTEVSHVITTNAVSSLIVTQACRDLLKRGDNPRVVMISSGLGSLSRAGGSSYAYRMSKAAMNMAARVLAVDGAMGGIIAVTLAPGWVRTDMGGPAANLSPEESARALLAIIKGLGNSDNGKFYRYDGVELEW